MRSFVWLPLMNALGFVGLGVGQSPEDDVRPKWGFPPPPLNRESDVREPIFRDLLIGASGDAPRFLSFGWKGGKDEEPPDDYFKTLADLKLPLKKVSECEVARDGVRCDKKTGNAGVVYSVSISKKINDNEAVLDASWVSGRRFGGGYSVRMVKEGKRWIPKEMLRVFAY